MSFNEKIRKALAKMVTACRRTLTEDVTNQLQETFGLYPDTSLPLDRLTHLTLDEAEAAQALREQLDHFAAAESGRPEERRSLAYDRLILEIAFTILNRLAALRLCEDRELVIECVRKGTSSDGFRLFNSISGGALGSIHETYRIFLECMMDELALDLGVLFDRTNPQSNIFPTERCLKEILDLLNDPDLAPVWSEDETIGWVYQYFNPPEERRAMREASQAPRNSRELAVRNQFFTPRYVVEFLTDNTLGRIWYEMRKGKTSLVEQCRYLVRRPNEVFLNPGEEPPVKNEAEKNILQEELLKMPNYILHRPKKDPRDIKSLDPACGSAHFLLYDFDLMETIYVEAWNDPESPESEVTGKTLNADYSTLEDLQRAVPELILRHNLHGIDIDLRAVQIAAFALWLRAQRSWKAQGIKTKNRPRITKSNIVCAEPMPGEIGMLQEFAAKLEPRVLGQLVEMVFDKMKQAGEAGSLLRIDEAVQKIVTEANRLWIQGLLSTKQAKISFDQDKTISKQYLRNPKKDVVPKEFWDLAEEQIIDALLEYAEHAENGQRISRQLFVEDAAKGIAFIDLCRKRFDVVLMNPPFGEPHINTISLIDNDPSYKDWNRNILCAFISRAGQFLSVNGYIGVVYDRTANIKNTYEDFRCRYFLSLTSAMTFILDLGWNVLDANVEVSAAVVKKISDKNPSDHNLTWGCNLTQIEIDQKPDILLHAIQSNDENLIKVVSRESLKRLPNSVIGYYFPDFLIRMFDSLPSLEKSGIKVFNGHTIKSDEFFRYWWESPISGSTYGLWARLYNGGSYTRYFAPPTDIVFYGENGSLISRHRSTIFRNMGLQQQPGLAFGKRGDFIDAHILRRGFVSTVEGQACSVKSNEHAYIGLAILNSHVFQYGINTYCGQHKYPGYVNLFPVPIFSELKLKNAVECCKNIIDLKQELSTYDETDPLFSSLIGGFQSIDSFLEFLFKTSKDIDMHHKYLNLNMFEAYGLSKDDIQKIELFCQNEPDDRIWDDEATYELDNKRIFMKRMISYALGIIFGRWDIRVDNCIMKLIKQLDPFDSLPAYPPAMLIGPDGYPARSNYIVSEEWLMARPGVNTLPPGGTVSNPAIPDSEYPLRISWNGILIDDSGWENGQPHKDSIVRRLREAFVLIWGDLMQSIEQEACQALNVSDLQKYFSLPSGFFQDHLKRYSKSRRKAPIYWPLSTASGSYTIWLYYPRLTDQTLYIVANEYLEPKIAEIGVGLSRTEEKLKATSGKDAGVLREKINAGRTLLSELKDLRQEILRIAALPYKPDLNDGVIINAAPFHKLFRLRSWAEDTEEVWNKLEKGEYDWSHLAYVLWPDRVREACRKDRSIAIAHGLEDLFQTPAPSSSKGTRGRRGRRSGRAA